MNSKSSSHIYELHLKDGEEKEDLLITLTPISGEVSIGVNPEVIPETAESSLYFNPTKLTKSVRIRAD